MRCPENRNGYACQQQAYHSGRHIFSNLVSATSHLFGPQPIITVMDDVVEGEYVIEEEEEEPKALA